jgi:hypothetical protein
MEAPLARSQVTRRGALTLFAMLLAFVAGAQIVQAHHGWRWTKDGKFEITGIVAEAKLGNPHGVLKLNVEGAVWTIEVGQPWRNRRAGLKDEMMAKGAEITIIGRRSAKESERVVKALRVRIKGKNYDLYPEML